MTDPAADISIIIPVFRDSARLYTALLSLSETPYFKGAEVIVVIDSDRESLNVANGFENIIIDFSAQRRGKGGAIMDGLNKATRSKIGFIDVDIPIGLDTFRAMYEMIGPYDAVIASRRVPSSIIKAYPPFWRRIASRTFNLMVRKMFGIQIYDTQCGAKVFKRTALRDVIDSVQEKGWAWDLELIIRLKQKFYNVLEYPADWSHMGGSTLKFKDVKEIFFSLIRIKRYI